MTRTLLRQKTPTCVPSSNFSTLIPYSGIGAPTTPFDHEPRGHRARPASYTSTAAPGRAAEPACWRPLARSSAAELPLLGASGEFPPIPWEFPRSPGVFARSSGAPSLRCQAHVRFADAGISRSQKIVRDGSVLRELPAAPDGALERPGMFHFPGLTPPGYSLAPLRGWKARCG